MAWGDWGASMGGLSANIARLRVVVVLMLMLWAGDGCGVPVFINEVHYDNSGVDVEEGVEIAGPAGTGLGDYMVVGYNGTGGAEYVTLGLSGVIPDEGTGFGAVWVPMAGLQNGSPDGLVLYRKSSGEVVQGLAWEGSMTAVGGVAAGRLLADMGVSQSGAEPASLTLQLTGTGTGLEAMSWVGPRTASRGKLNAGQTLTAVTGPTTAAGLVPSQAREGAEVMLTLVLTPAPGGVVEMDLAVTPRGGLVLPGRVTVPASGVLTVPVRVPVDGLVEGYELVSVVASDPLGSRPPAGAVLGVIDADRPRGAPEGSVRVMSFNVLLGTGGPGSAGFEAAREVTERISPDVILFQEVASAGEFGDLVAFLKAAGFPGTPETMALKGDAFAGVPLVRGDLSGSQDAAVVVASRWPLKRRVQVGRGLAGRREITRFPMLAEVDVPWLGAADDPVFVSVHLKAERSDADFFRRALEVMRLREGLVAAGIDPAVRNVVVGGDFNETDWLEQPEFYRTDAAAVQVPGTLFPDGSALPSTFLGGSDLAAGLTLRYRVFPHSGMEMAGMKALGLRQADGVSEVTWPGLGSKLDYLFVSGPVVSRGGGEGEVYNSEVEAVADGLPKREGMAVSGLSGQASDHFAVFADVPMTGLPGLELRAEREWVNEGEVIGFEVGLGRVWAEPVAVTVRSWRDGRVVVPEPVVIPAGQTSVRVVTAVPWLGGLEAHRAVMVEASAPGWRRGFARVMVRNREASGQVLITQYAEPAAGSAGRALELMNLSGSAIDLGRRPVEVRRYADGGGGGAVEARAGSGQWPAGGVLVVGDEAAGAWLVGIGVLPAQGFAGVADGTVISNAAGAAVLLIDRMGFDGNDALEVLFDGVRSDVFGEIGHDPGSGWSGPGVERTVNRSLALRGVVATGSGGWRVPGVRFADSGVGLAGFGVAPVLTDPWLGWAAAAGLSGMRAAMAADPDGDGAVNLLEYALGSAPHDGRAGPLLDVTADGRGIERVMRVRDGALRFQVEASDDLVRWAPVAGSETVLEVWPDGSERRRFRAGDAGSGRRWYRQRVVRE